MGRPVSEVATIEQGDRAVCCDDCGSILYVTNGTDVKLARMKETAADGAIREYARLPVRPISITAGNQRLLFCSRNCACQWIQSAPEASLKTGYPIWP